MPIRTQNDLPAKAILENENIFVMDEERAITQDIRPLKIAILNLMPLKEELKHELNNITLDDIGCVEKINEQMDIYLAEMKIEMN